MTRPWRLTRRQRVEMEAALMYARQAVQRRPVDRLRDFERVEDYAWAMGVRDLTWSQTWPWPREVREVRARVAIALRAALRADEDARCEEAMARLGDGWSSHWFIGYARGVVSMCEWPELPLDHVPLALWEVAR